MVLETISSYIFSFEVSYLRRFYKNIILMMIPAIFITLFVARYWLIGYYAGELKDIDKVILEQRNSDCLVGMAYNEQTPYMKLENVNQYKPELIALGTSRVMQFKEDFFECSFYNCGGAVSGNYDEYVNFLENMTYVPKYVILGLDVWVFNDRWNQKCKVYDTYVEIEKQSRSRRAIVKEIEAAFNDGSLNYHSLDNFTNGIGVNARVKGNGFSKDGSYVYRNTYQYPERQVDYNFADTYSRIDSGDRRFEYGEHCDVDTIEKLSVLLEYCQDKGIHVIGFLAPMAPSVCNKMLRSGEYKYINEISPFCNELFEQYGFEYYDYWNPTDFGIDDSYYIDGFHSSEVANAIMLIKMIQNGCKLKDVCSGENLLRMIDTRYSNLCFDNPFE